MRLIRILLVLSGAGFMLPSPPETVPGQPVPVAAEQVSTLDMLSSASSAVSDMAGFCGRQPEVCTTATYLAGKLEAKAKYSVKLLYEWANESTSGPAIAPAPQEASKSDLLITGTVLAKAETRTPPKSQSTLGIEDLIPEWRGPVKRKIAAPDKKEG
jgi:hypothetical protein